jgi:hypothetical protein
VRADYPLEQRPSEHVEAVVLVPDLEGREVRRGVQRSTWGRAGTMIVRGVRTTWGPTGMVIVRVGDNLKTGRETG